MFFIRQGRNEFIRGVIFCISIIYGRPPTSIITNSGNDMYIEITWLLFNLINNALL